ncbi:MAG: hypothetical protein MUE40_06555 [Anaerolineae bacterium]|nr:hypothetical protein [Anaerolineae bacterium]
MLERHSRPNTAAPELYDENLSRALLRLTLDDERQRAAAHYLATLAQNHPESAASYVYALGRCPPEPMIEPLLRLLAEQGHRLDSEAAYQAVVALETCVKTGSAAVLAALRARDPAPILARWADGDEDDLGDRADRVLEQVEKIVGGNG